LANVVILAQTEKPKPSGAIEGIVQSENVPIPGVMITATNTSNEEKVTTSTDLNGQYHISVSTRGSYILETSMPAFAPASKEAAVEEQNSPVRLDFSLTLASRSQQQSAPPRAAIGFRGRGAQRLELQQAAGA